VTSMNTDRITKAALRRKYQVRKTVSGTRERPRLTVFRSNRHIYAQIIDDTAGVTLVSCGTKSQGLRDQVTKAGKKNAAKLVGEAIAKQALGVGIRCVCFDRNRYRYHGRIRSLAEGARQGGLVF
jgi:large subunit ribosomal protein L18